ncbi:MAG: hypothetical protein M2R45_02029 [Verrucomicrobia subdivision 3 bacterium]|nr:hypothetical protein [Limisphaerales bacterium]MCS1414848.1 hypothetical protein [Limisphaerales bacterium]
MLIDQLVDQFWRRTPGRYLGKGNIGPTSRCACIGHRHRGSIDDFRVVIEQVLGLLVFLNLVYQDRTYFFTSQCLVPPSIQLSSLFLWQGDAQAGYQHIGAGENITVFQGKAGVHVFLAKKMIGLSGLLGSSMLSA